MSRKRDTIYNILIVCEGAQTEPNYFRGIREEVIRTGVWPEKVNIQIRPKRDLDGEAEENYPSKHKQPRNKRQLRAGTGSVPEAGIEDDYKAFPIRFVREAQKGLEDGTFNEAWAVFDKDYHPRHAEAFQLAETLIEGKKVNIAFSSIAFEHWVLLHFERNTTQFLKSECKGSDKKPLKCGTGVNSGDCNGSNCVIGYLKARQYLSDYSKNANIDLYALLRDHTLAAIEHSSWVRSRIFGKPIYTLNPYTNVDLLVKRLLRIENQWIWLQPVSSWEKESIRMELGSPTEGLVPFSITNNNSISYVFNKVVQVFRDGDLAGEVAFDFGIMLPGQTIKYDLDISTWNPESPNLELRMDFDKKTRVVIELG